MSVAEKVTCRTPNGGAATNIPAWKFDACRAALLAELAANEAVRAADLITGATARLAARDRDRLGSPGWHLTTTRLELEVRGEIRRVPGAPVRLALP
ncbi:DUF6958 family protein [Jannaschia ovalis]|uniref:DUF6958 family protein n=1 Tax=Jannaschia ovalis TaxID=3038773 RepID=UPI0038B2A716